MWTTQIEDLANDPGQRFAVALNGAPVSYSDLLRRWQDDTSFRSYFMGLLVDSPFSAFRWETPAITDATANRPFEFVLFDSPGLASRPDRQAFAEHYGAANDGIVEFSNLRKDALLVVPSPIGPDTAYGHLAAFMRQAPEAQRHALWKRVGAAMERRLGSRPVWLSTAGAGVSWLHVRLDDRPKYYSHGPYRVTP